MKSLCLLVFLLAPACAQEKWMYSEEVVYDGHAETTWYKLQGGREVKIVGDDVTWPLLDAWAIGKHILLAYNATRGPALVDPDKGTIIALVEIDGEHPIDVGSKKCFETARTTQSMVECKDQLGRAWKAEMERVYALMMKSLKADQQGKLRTAQDQWLKFYDAEVEAIVAIDTDGSISRINRASRLSSLYRARALQLSSLNAGN